MTKVADPFGVAETAKRSGWGTTFVPDEARRRTLAAKMAADFTRWGHLHDDKLPCWVASFEGHRPPREYMDLLASTVEKVGLDVETAALGAAMTAMRDALGEYKDKAALHETALLETAKRLAAAMERMYREERAERAEPETPEPAREPVPGSRYARALERARRGE